jgi:carbon storage regulator
MTAMLVLTRKVDEQIIVGDNITITVVAIQGNRVKLGIQAPSNVTILRSELQQAGEHLSAPANPAFSTRAG